MLGCMDHVFIAAATPVIIRDLLEFFNDLRFSKCRIMGLTDGFGSISDRDRRLEQTDRQPNRYLQQHTLCYAWHRAGKILHWPTPFLNVVVLAEVFVYEQYCRHFFAAYKTR